MKINSMLALVVAVLAALALWFWWPETAPPPPTPPTNNEESAVTPEQAELDKQAAAATANSEKIERQAVTPEVAETDDAETGSVVVRVLYGDDKTGAAGMPMALRKLGRDSRFSSMRTKTDDTGAARFDNVAPGNLYVAPVNLRGKRVEAIAGETVEVEIVLRIGMNLSGIVVNQDKQPVAGALIEAAPMAHADAFPEVRAVSGADGRFAIRASDTLTLVGARAKGYVASNVRFLHGKEGNTPEIELVLGPKGGMVHGTVVDEEGTPVANATVIIGEGELSGIGGRDHIPPFPALARSDENGKFEAIGIPAGTQPVKCRAQGFAPYEGECEVNVGVSTALTVTLAPGATIEGLVVDNEGKPTSKAEVRIGSWSDFVFFRTRTESDGTFALTGLPAAELKLLASHDDLGKGEKVVTTESGKTATAELTLSRGFLLRGRVIDPEGNPVAGTYCECMEEKASEKSWFKFAKTNAQGEFVADNCPEKGTVSIRVSARNFEELRKTGIDPHAGPVVMQLKRRPPPTVRISGTVVAPDGKPIQGATISASRKGARGGVGLESTDKNGRFELGPHPQGTWTITVRDGAYPTYRSEPRELGENGMWELGTITMQQGGTAVVKPTGAVEMKAYFYATDIKLKTTVGFQTINGLKKSSPMLPGDYLLLATGKGVASTSKSFTVRVGEETQLECEVQKGVDQSIKVTRADGQKLEPFSVHVRRGTTLVARVWARAQPDGSLVAEACLAPGSYTAVANRDELSGSTSLSIGATPGAQASITLR